MELGEVYVKIGADTKELSAGLTKARGQVKQTSEQMRAQMKALGMGMVIAGAAITAAFALTVKGAISFQKELAQVSTMLDKSAMKIMPQYKKGLLDMSVAFGESTDTLSRGLYDILSASIPPAKALEVLEIAATAATAGITDTGVAADAITTILNSYGMQAEDAGKVSDILFAVVKRGKLTFDELAPAIGKSAALASQSGLSFEDLGATIATLTRAGIRTSEAMTSINGVLRAFLKPTDDAKEAAEEFGLELNTNTLRTIGMTGVMEKLTGATAEQLAAIFPNIRGLKGMAAALGDTEGYAKDYALMLNSAGLTQEAFAKQSATLGFKIEQLKKSFNVIAVTIGDALIPVIQSIVVSIGKVIATVSKWMEENPKLTATLVKLGAAFGVFTIAGGLLILGALYFSKLTTTIKGMVAASKLAITTNVAMATSMKNTEIMGVRATTIMRSTGAGARAMAAEFTLAAANIIIWSEVWREWQKIAKSVHTTTEDIIDAQLKMLKMQEETAKKFGVTLEVFQEWQESGEGVREVSEDVAAVMDKLAAKKLFEEQIKELAEFEKKMRSMESELSAMTIGSKQWQLLSQEIAATKGEMEDLGDAMKKTALAEGIVENAKIIKTTVSGLMLDIDLLAKGFELTGKSVEESATHYSSLIEKLNVVDVILQTELMLLKEGTEAYKEKQAEIYENAKAIKELEASLKGLIGPLKGLELIAAKMAILGDSTEDTKAKIELLSGRAILLQKALDEAIPDTQAWWEAKIAFEANQVAIEGLTDKLAELTEEEKEAVVQAERLKDVYKTVADRIFELTHTAMEVNIRKLKEQKQAYIDLGMSIGEANKWYGLEIAKLQEVNVGLDENIDKLEETATATSKVTQFLGQSWTQVAKEIDKASVALTNFTLEGVASAIASIKMHYYPEISRLSKLLRGNLRSMFSDLRPIYEADLATVLEQMNADINAVEYGFEVYNKEIGELPSSYESARAAANSAAKSMVSGWVSVTNAANQAAAATGSVSGGSWRTPTSYQQGTPYVPKTGLYKLEKGERVIPANQNTYHNSFSPTVNLTVQGSGSSKSIAQEVENVLYDMGRQFKRRGFEMIPGRG